MLRRAGGLSATPLNLPAIALQLWMTVTCYCVWLLHSAFLYQIHKNRHVYAHWHWKSCLMDSHITVKTYECYLFIIDILPIDSNKETMSHNFLSIIWTSTKSDSTPEKSHIILNRIFTNIQKKNQPKALYWSIKRDDLCVSAPLVGVFYEQAWQQGFGVSRQCSGKLDVLH